MDSIEEETVEMMEGPIKSPEGRRMNWTEVGVELKEVEGEMEGEMEGEVDDIVVGAMRLRKRDLSASLTQAEGRAGEEAGRKLLSVAGHITRETG
mmetsp:Transcript_26691/g.49027  ORF Transcript_26691/g.49027 Transcript_26691/m.49027 type:complete len:95 (-) Transcript_26691:50-334(-)